MPANNSPDAVSFSCVEHSLSLSTAQERDKAVGIQLSIDTGATGGLHWGGVGEFRLKFSECADQ